MSKKKRSELNDQPIEGFADLEDEAPPAREPAGSRSSGEARPARDHAEPAQAAPPRPSVVRPPTPRKKSQQRSLSSVRAGVIFAASVVVAGLGLGGTSLLVGGGTLSDLWHPGDLLTPQNYLLPVDHPLNLVAAVALAVGLLAALGGRALSSEFRRLETERLNAERLLDKLTALRLDNEGPWADVVLRDHAGASTFTSEILGAWRLQNARHKRLMGLEGEMHRLQKGLAENAREVLTGRFDSPAVGTLADEMVRFLDARTAAADELAELRQRDRTESEAIVGLIQDARLWNRTTLEQIGTQGTALERLSRRLEDLAMSLGADAGDGTGSEAAGILADIRHELGGRGAFTGLPTAELDEMAAQGSKLAFQIAMEVARLGPRGERLQPLSQTLEQLTTQLRQTLTDQGGEADAGATGLGAVLGKLDSLSQNLDRAGGGAVGSELLEEIGHAGPAVGKAAANLSEIARRFQAQTERLVKLGESFSALTGAAFDSGAIPVTDPDDSPEGSLRVLPQDPFCHRESATAEVDPFTVETPLAATTSHPILEPVAFEPAPVEPVLQEPMPMEPVLHVPVLGEPAPMEPAPVEPVLREPAPMEPVLHVPVLREPVPLEPVLHVPAPLPPAPPAPVVAADDGPLEIERTSQGGSLLADVPAVVMPPLELEPMVPQHQEHIYDLAAFGARLLPAEPAATEPAAAAPRHRPAAAEDRIYDLAEFGAVRLDDVDADGEPIYDLAEFGAVLVS